MGARVFSRHLCHLSAPLLHRAQLVHADLIAATAKERNVALAEDYMALQPMVCAWWMTMLPCCG